MKSTPSIILHVEPNLSCARLMQILLTRYSHYEIIHTTNTDKAIDLTIQLKPDLILTEMQLGNMTGLEFVKLLRTNQLTQHIPVVGVSANADPDDILIALQDGIDGYITKPFILTELHKCIRKFLDK